MVVIIVVRSITPWVNYAGVPVVKIAYLMKAWRNIESWLTYYMMRRIVRGGTVMLTTIIAEEYADWLGLVTFNMLMGKEGIDFGYYECDEYWWQIRLYVRIN